jgi:hypothetical protein
MASKAGNSKRPRTKHHKDPRPPVVHTSGTDYKLDGVDRSDGKAFVVKGDKQISKLVKYRDAVKLARTLNHKPVRNLTAREQEMVS